MESHVDIIKWVVMFFLAGMGVYVLPFYFIVRGLKVLVKRVEKEYVDGKKEHEKAITILDAKKVDLVLHVKDKDEMMDVVKGLQTTNMCDALRMGCGGRIEFELQELRKTMDQILVNQADLEGIKKVMDLVVERQAKVISRIDSHINGNK